MGAVVVWLERLKGWRTLAFNVVIGILPLLVDVTGYLSGFGWSLIFADQKVAMMWTGALSIGNILLRYLTTTPVFKRES